MTRWVFALMFVLLAGPASADAVARFEADGLNTCLAAQEAVEHPEPTVGGLKSGTYPGNLTYCFMVFAKADAAAITERFDAWSAEAVASGRYVETALRRFESFEWREPVIVVDLTAADTGGVVFQVQEIAKEA